MDKLVKVIGLLSLTTTTIPVITLTIPKTNTNISIVDPDEVDSNESTSQDNENPPPAVPSKTDIGELIGGTNIGSIYSAPSVSKGFLNTVLGKVSEAVPEFSTITTTGFSISVYSDNGCTITVDGTNPLYYGTANIIYEYSDNLRPLSEDINGSGLFLYTDRATSGFTTRPTLGQLLSRVKQLNPNANCNQITSTNISTLNYDIDSQYYYVTLSPVANSTIYSGTSINVYFHLYQKNVSLLGCTVFYEGDVAPTVNNNQIVLNCNGWYDIRQDSVVNDKALTSAGDVTLVDVTFENNIQFLPTNCNPIMFVNNADGSTFNLIVANTSTITATAPVDYDTIFVNSKQTLQFKGTGLWQLTNSSGYCSVIGAHLNAVGTIRVLDSVSINATRSNADVKTAEGNSTYAAIIGTGNNNNIGGSGQTPYNIAYDVTCININTTGTLNLLGADNKNAGPAIGTSHLACSLSRGDYPPGTLWKVEINNGTINAPGGVASGRTAKAYWSGSNSASFRNFTMTGGTLNTSFIGTNFKFTRSNASEVTGAYMSAFTMSGGYINIKKYDGITTPYCGIGNVWCANGRTSITCTTSNSAYIAQYKTWASGDFSTIYDITVDSSHITADDGVTPNDGHIFYSGMAGVVTGTWEGYDSRYPILLNQYVNGTNFNASGSNQLITTLPATGVGGQTLTGTYTLGDTTNFTFNSATRQLYNNASNMTASDTAYETQLVFSSTTPKYPYESKFIVPVVINYKNAAPTLSGSYASSVTYNETTDQSIGTVTPSVAGGTYTISNTTYFKINASTGEVFVLAGTEAGTTYTATVTYKIDNYYPVTKAVSVKVNA